MTGPIYVCGAEPGDVIEVRHKGIFVPWTVTKVTLHQTVRTWQSYIIAFCEWCTLPAVVAFWSYIPALPFI